MNDDMTDDLVKWLNDFQHMMPEGGSIDPLIEVFQSLAKESADAIERLTAERDAAWVAGRDAAAQVADEYSARMLDAFNRQVAKGGHGTVPASKTDAGESIAAAIRALSPSTLNKPE